MTSLLARLLLPAVGAALWPATSAAQGGAVRMAEGQNLALEVRARAAEVLAALPEVPAALHDALVVTSETGEALWHLQVALGSLGYMALGVAAALGIRAWSRRQFLQMFDLRPATRAGRTGYLLARAALQTLGLAVFAAVSMVASLLLDAGGESARWTHAILVAVAVAVALVRIASLALLAPDAPHHRMLHVADAPARGLHRSLVASAAVALLLLYACFWLAALGLRPDVHVLLLIAASLAAALMLSAVAIRYRAAVAGILLGPGGDRQRPTALRLLARTWHVLAAAYLLGAWLVTAARHLLGLPGAYGLVAAPVQAVLGGVALYWLLLLVIDKVSARRAAGRAAVTDAQAPAAGSPEAHEEAQGGPRGRPRTLRDLAEHAAAIVAWVAAAWLMLLVWGVDVSTEESLLVRAADVVIVLFLAYLGYQAIRIAIDLRMAEEGTFEIGAPGDEPGAVPGASRLATLLPLARNFLLVTVLVIAGMILLSQLGVDIAPLFAGAGVVGVAVGFGAQALIRDIFSGAFFLIDDAFRLGEYIEVGETMGTVEKISIRSMQVRHHLGALHTIPFGEITQLTNHSRDWAMMKLKLRVTYDTDIERARKLIKKIGKDLLEHPEIGEKFIQPVKSQGVHAMEDSAMILRVKFMTRPGEQWEVRKHVYAAIKDAFAREGIKFAHREVTVRVAEDDAREPGPLSAGRKRAIAGAALPAIEAGGEGAGSDADAGRER